MPDQSDYTWIPDLLQTQPLKYDDETGNSLEAEHS